MSVADVIALAALALLTVPVALVLVVAMLRGYRVGIEFRRDDVSR